MSTDLSDKARRAHFEINEDGRELWHAGYEIAYCEKCNQPVIHSRAVNIEPNCGRKECQSKRG